ncbi:MAG TPA: hypothetical protein VJN50_07985 [Actinomycetota bacterium]|nr:hypothetical protein [Actinomycetota bacterium]
MVTQRAEDEPEAADDEEVRAGADAEVTDLRASLEREMYWGEEASKAHLSSGELRDAIHDFAALLRADERELIPRGEPNLGSHSRWRRQTKLRLFRVLRPITRRYDRLTGDLAELTQALADRVTALEAEVTRLRSKLDGSGEEREDR